MIDDPIYCGSPGAEYTAALRCPDCGPRDMDVTQYDRFEGVIRVRCPGCGFELFTNGTVPVSRMKVKAVVETFPEPTTAVGGEDDGE